MNLWYLTLEKINLLLILLHGRSRHIAITHLGQHLEHISRIVEANGSTEIVTNEFSDILYICIKVLHIQRNELDPITVTHS